MATNSAPIALSAARSTPFPRLSPETQFTLCELSRFIGKNGMAVLWAENFQQRNGLLPTCTQIVSGVDAELCVKISLKSAERALATLRRTCP